jgi:hypothetical protein
MKNYLGMIMLLVVIAFSATLAFGQDATVAVTAPEINPTLSAYEEARAVIVDAILALGAIGIAYLGRLVAQLLGQGIANQVRLYMNQVFRNIVVTQLGRTEHAETALTNATVKKEVIDGAAVGLIAKIPDALAKFNMGLNVESQPLRDKIEAEITKVLLETDPQKTLAKPAPEKIDNVRDLDAPYSPQKKEPKP